MMMSCIRFMVTFLCSLVAAFQSLMLTDLKGKLQFDQLAIRKLIWLSGSCSDDVWSLNANITTSLKTGKIGSRNQKLFDDISDFFPPLLNVSATKNQTSLLAFDSLIFLAKLQHGAFFSPPSNGRGWHNQSAAFTLKNVTFWEACAKVTSTLLRRTTRKTRDVIDNSLNAAAEKVCIWSVRRF